MHKATERHEQNYKQSLRKGHLLDLGVMMSVALEHVLIPFRGWVAEPLANGSRAFSRERMNYKCKERE